MAVAIASYTVVKATVRAGRLISQQRLLLILSTLEKSTIECSCKTKTS